MIASIYLNKNIKLILNEATKLCKCAWYTNSEVKLYSSRERINEFVLQVI